ncbi:MAG: hypothetical protein WEB58_13985 [Planctomycetaceae bacterium]
MNTLTFLLNRSMLSPLLMAATLILAGIASIRNVIGQETDAALNVEVDESQPEAEPIDIPADAVDLPAGVYEQVASRSIGISPAESSAYYAVLNHAKVVPADRLRQAARQQRTIRQETSPLFKDKPIEKFQPFVDLFKHPEAYVGKSVTLSGYTRRLITASADPNPYGVKTLYELWLFTDDSQNNPLVVVCTDIPPDLPRGDELINGISVTGYFFKLYGYDAADSRRLAPMILAHRVEWNPPSAPPMLVSPWVLYPGLIAVIGLILFFLWYMAYRDRMNSPLKRVTLEAPERLSWPAGSAGPESSVSSSDGMPPHSGMSREMGRDTESDKRV